MRHVASKACLSAALCLVLTHQAWGDMMRCGDKLVQKGDSVVTLKALCGAPASVEQTFTPNNVPMEIWTYNRGPQQFLVTVRIVNGTVVAIETLHQYGQ
jgi:Protein of unknown function (DUF2845)